jgi:hypothetical protein
MLFFQRLLIIFLMTALGINPAHSGTPHGIMEGHLNIVSGSPVQLADETRARVTVESSGDFSSYPLIILSREKRKEVTRVTADKNGNYRVALPPGAYVLDIEGRVRKRLRVITQGFTVVPNETVRVDMTILTGFASE